MRVVYKTVRQEIDEAIEAAAKQNRRISYIELTESELRQIHNELTPHLMYPNNFDDDRFVGKYAGVELRVKR